MSFYCECLSCGHKMESEKHCMEIICPKCKGRMRRADRPGIGSGVGRPGVGRR